MSRYLYKKIQNISPESLNFQHSGLKLTTLGSDPNVVLFPPFLPLDMEEIDLSKREKLSIHDMHGNPPVGKYLLKMGEFPDYRKTITFSKEELLEKLLSGKEEAAICLKKMNAGQWDEDFQEYISWKENLHDYLKLVYSDMWYGE